jgi:glutamate 5-kinase
VVIVSSGAIGAGLGQLSLKRRPSDLPHLQAAAAIGQSVLIRTYDEAFRKHGCHAAQILLTAADFEDRSRYLNVRNTILTLFDYKSVPIINENDTVSVDEIRFGDNDRLAAMVTNLLRAPLLVILSVVDGLYTKDPAENKGQRRHGKGKQNASASHASGDSHRSLDAGSRGPGQQPELISTVESMDEHIRQLAGSSKSALGTGGMATKLQAAQMCTSAGESVWIVGGKRHGVLGSVLAAEPIGTLFLPRGGSLTARKRWIGLTVRPRGRYVVDAGARRAIERSGKSLLAIGVLDVVGHFEQGDIVTICDPSGEEFARGLTNYSADDARKIRGLRTPQIQAVLGSEPYDEVIHRDNLVKNDCS